VVYRPDDGGRSGSAAVWLAGVPGGVNPLRQGFVCAWPVEGFKAAGRAEVLAE